MGTRNFTAKWHFQKPVRNNYSVLFYVLTDSTHLKLSLNKMKWSRKRLTPPPHPITSQCHVTGTDFPLEDWKLKNSTRFKLIRNISVVLLRCQLQELSSATFTQLILFHDFRECVCKDLRCILILLIHV